MHRLHCYIILTMKILFLHITRKQFELLKFANSYLYIVDYIILGFVYFNELYDILTFNILHSVSHP